MVRIGVSRCLLGDTVRWDGGCQPDRLAAYRSREALVAKAKGRLRASLSDESVTTMDALRAIATPARHVNVMHHMLGHLRRSSHAPLVGPLALLRDHVNRCNVDDLLGQTYLEPPPREPALGNHV